MLAGFIYMFIIWTIIVIILTVPHKKPKEIKHVDIDTAYVLSVYENIWGPESLINIEDL